VQRPPPLESIQPPNESVGASWEIVNPGPIASEDEKDQREEEERDTEVDDE